MVRSTHQLVERLTLVWHSWFATSIDGATSALMIRQNEMMRARALGNFHDLLVEVTRDPAMLLWLSGTDNSQSQTFSSGLSVIAEAIAAFQADLEARGLADRVVTHVWSEFGRRAQENGGLGTDHGAAGVAMIIGTRVTGTMVGEWPALTNLDANGNQKENAP